MSGTSLVEAVHGWSTRRPEAVALADSSHVLSWSDLAAAVDGAARRLTTEGVERDVRVAIVADLSLEAAVATLAVLQVGASVCPLPTSAADEPLRAALNGLGPALVLSDSGAPDAATHGAFRVRPLPRIGLSARADQHRLTALTEPPRVDSAEACVLSDLDEGESVSYSHASLVAGIFELTLQAPELLGGRTLNTQPLWCAAGLVHGLLTPLVLGGGVVLLSPWDATAALRLIADERVVAFQAPAACWRELADELDVRDRNTTSLRIAAVHESLDQDLPRRWLRRHVPLHQTIGLKTTRPAAALAVAGVPVASGVGILHRVSTADATREPRKPLTAERRP